jgi:hypothetical protein
MRAAQASQGDCLRDHTPQESSLLQPEANTHRQVILGYQSRELSPPCEAPPLLLSLQLHFHTALSHPHGRPHFPNLGWSTTTSALPFIAVTDQVDAEAEQLAASGKGWVRPGRPCR